jgi:hypothetical protein
MEEPMNRNLLAASTLTALALALSISTAHARNAPVPPFQPVAVPDPYNGCQEAILQRMQHTQEIVGKLVSGYYETRYRDARQEPFIRDWAQRAQEQMNVQRDLARANPVPERELCHRLLTVIADQEAQVREMYGVQ